MSYAHCPRYLNPCDADLENPHLVCLPQDGVETISPLQIDAGLRFPYYPDLVDM